MKSPTRFTRSQIAQAAARIRTREDLMPTSGPSEPHVVTHPDVVALREDVKLKASIEAVFALGGGELEDECFEEGGVTYLWWFEGVPEYAAREHREDRRRLVTVIACEIFGEAKAPEGWERVRAFRSSGETSCPWCGDGTGNEDCRSACELCEGDGLVYLGEGWSEVVFARTAVLRRPEDYLEGVVAQTHDFQRDVVCDGASYALLDVPQPWTSFVLTYAVPAGASVDDHEYSPSDGLDWMQRHAVGDRRLLKTLASLTRVSLHVPYSIDVIYPDEEVS